MCLLVSSIKKESTRNAGDPSSIPGLGRIPGEGKDNSLQCSCLENPMNRGAWWAAVHGVAKIQTGLKRISMQHALLLILLHSPERLHLKSLISQFS